MSTTALHERAWVDVDLAALVANARTVQAAAAGAALLPMVKADAYGLGAIPVVRALEAVAPWGYGVATVDEAMRLRTAGIDRPLVVFTPPRPEQRQSYRRGGLRAVLDTPELAAIWDGPFHLEIDTGMGRCGVRWDDREALARCAVPQLEGAFTHFAAADEGTASVDRQWPRFTHALSVLGRRPMLVHAANSAAAFRLRESLDLVRPGIFLYGGRHAPDLAPPQPVAAVRARVASLRALPAGESVSYGGDWVAPQPTRVATLAIGYADGVPRAVKGKAEVILRDARRPVVGRVTMDFMMVALREADHVALGDVATVVGAAGGQAIGIDEFAAWGGTNAYEALARLGPRLPRIYGGGGAA